MERLMTFTVIKQKFLLWAWIFLMVSMLTACGTSAVTGETLTPDASVVEAGNPPSSKPRKLEGSTTVAKNGQCTADELESYDTAGKLVTTEVNADCTFSTSLNSGKAWGVRFYNQGDVIGTMVFENGSGLPLSFVYYTSDSSSSVDFGEVHFASLWAYPAVQPATQNDRDGDGQTDYVDADDDNDGILDDAETDCDNNHIWDDLEVTDC